MLLGVRVCWVFFFFKQKTAYEMRISDWSSDVCSSDLHRARARAAPRPHRNIVILRPFDEIGDDQEIAGKAHLDDDPDFEVEPREIGLALRLGERLARKRIDLSEPHRETGDRLLPKLCRLALHVDTSSRPKRLAVWT